MSVTVAKLLLPLAFALLAAPVLAKDNVLVRQPAASVVVEDEPPELQNLTRDILTAPLPDMTVRKKLPAPPASAAPPSWARQPSVAAKPPAPAESLPVIAEPLPAASLPTAVHPAEPEDLPPVKPETPDSTVAMPIPETALDHAAKLVRPKAAARETAPAINNAPVIMDSPEILASRPVPAELTRYQFLPLFAKGAAPDALPLLWPILSSHPLAASHALVRRVVIVIHDAVRDAAGALQQLQPLAGPTVSGSRANTLVIAPLFPIRPDRARFKPLLTDAAQHVSVWDAESWWQGGTTTPSDNLQRQVSSMTALDMLLLILADNKLYPELREIIIAGYGRGADFVHRYALYGRAPEVLSAQRLFPHYLVVGAQSYVYLTDSRPTKALGAFAAPKDTKICPNYQDYPYGLEHPNEYARQTPGNMARLGYAERHVTYLVGGNAGPLAADQECGAAWEGVSVRDRAINYDAFLKNSFGDLPKQRLLVMPGIGDDPMALLTSNCGASLLFSDGECLLSNQDRH